jgi:hypothetical protein
MIKDATIDPAGKRCFLTVATKSHLAPALALALSLQRSGNPENLHLLIPDAVEGELPDPPAGVVFHRLDEVRAMFPERMVYYFGPLELCVALKTFAAALLLEKGAEAVIYLDNDVFAAGSFEPAWQALRQSPVLLTPHVLHPPDPSLKYIDEVAITGQGIYNGGFSGWACHPGATAALAWLNSRLPIYGFYRRTQGMCGDQTLLTLLPNYFTDMVAISRDPALNIAFWNLQERHVVREHGQYLIEGRPVVFFHMSGFRPAKPDAVCSYLGGEQNRQMFAQAPWFHEVMKDYAAILREASRLVVFAAGPYRFARYKGFKLNAPLRTILFKKGKLSWRDREVWKVLLVERLRLIKRWILSWAKQTNSNGLCC